MDFIGIAAIISAMAAILSAITGMIVALGLRRNTAVTVETAKIGKENHKMLNSQHDAAIEQQTRTDNALRAAGIPIPANPAVDVQVAGTEKVDT